MMHITNRQARQFMLLKHGLLGDHIFEGKQGVLDWVRQAGCVQFDPIDVCGRNAELTLQSRVKGFAKPLLDELLYEDRRLIDYPDKNLAILRIEDWPYMERSRQAARQHAERYPEMAALSGQVRAHIEAHGPIGSDGLQLEGDYVWQSAIHWSGGANVTRSVLEQMYATGELVIHRKRGTRKSYDLAERHVPSHLLHAPEPLPEDSEHRKWLVRRRIGAVGLLWNRASDAWLHISRMKSAQRNDAFRELLAEGRIAAVSVEQMKDTLYCLAEDVPLLETVLAGDIAPAPRCELIAPLDSFLWDRKLIYQLFGFDYTWEIYTPVAKRKFGYYVLPLLYGDQLVGRVEAVAERKAGTLHVKHVWFEEGVERSEALQEALSECLARFARFNSCETIVIEAEAE